MEYLYDAHCHLDTPYELIADDTPPPVIPNLMMTNPQDCDYIKKALQNHQNKTASNAPLSDIYVNFGIHPWFCHLFTLEECVDKKTHYQDIINLGNNTTLDDSTYESFPDPINLDRFIEQNLFNSNFWIGIGEVGLDKIATLTVELKDGPDSMPVSVKVKGKIKMEHQLSVFRRFLELGHQYNKPISVHCVKCHGVLFNCLKAFIEETPSFQSSIVLHSFTGSIDSLKLFLKEIPNCFISLSEFINVNQLKHKSMIQEVPLNRVLCETDMNIKSRDRVAGQKSQRQALLKVVDLLAQIHNSTQEDVIKQLSNNFLRAYNLGVSSVS